MTSLSTDVRSTLENVRDRLENILERIKPDRDRKDDRSEMMQRRPFFEGPDVDIEETADAYIINAELPGMRPGDISVESSRNRVILRGQKVEEHSDDSKGYQRMERRYGSFMRVIALSSDIDPDAVTAAYKDGVLRLLLPKTPESRARRINIAAASA